MTQRRIVVTGASSGIGAATAVALAAEGVSLWLAYGSNAAAAAEVAAACRQSGAEVRTAALDLGSTEAIRALWDDVEATWGELHVLVNNGSTCPYTDWEAITVDEWDRVLETNARGTFLMCQRAVPLLRRADGDRAIVNVSSVAGQIGGVTTSVHYAASKAAILAVTRSLARLLAADRIRVNAVTPGPIATGITDQLAPERRASLAATVPLGRFGTAEEVASTIALLASEAAGFTTGATYDVNGGLRID